MSQLQIKTANDREDRLNDLFKEWDQQAHAVRSMECRMADRGPKAQAKPSLLGRLANWLMQLVTLKNKESDTLSKICEIERKHSQLREAKQLRHVIPKEEMMPKPESKKKSNFWFWMVLLMLMTKKKRKAMPSLQLG